MVINEINFSNATTGTIDCGRTCKRLCSTISLSIPSCFAMASIYCWPVGYSSIEHQFNQ